MLISKKYHLDTEEYLEFIKDNLPYEGSMKFISENVNYTKVEYDDGVGSDKDYLARTFDNVKVFNKEMYALTKMDSKGYLDKLSEEMFFEKINELDKSKTKIERRIVHDYEIPNDIEPYNVTIVIWVTDESTFAIIEFKDEESYNNFIIPKCLKEIN